MSKCLPLVTIVTATYNLEKNNRFQCMEKCIHSVAMQDYPNIEHLIIDGASTDGTLKFLDKYKDNLVINSEKDKGLYDAFNKGIKKAKGKYIAFLGSDDLYAGNDVISKMVNKLEENQADWVYGDTYYVTDKQIILWKGKISYLIFGSSPCHQSTMFSVKALKDIGLIKDDIVSGDTLSMIALMANGYKSCYVEEPLSIFNVGGASSNVDVLNEDYINSFVKHFYEIVKDKLPLTIEDCRNLYMGKCYETLTTEELVSLANKLKYSEWVQSLFNKDIVVFTKLLYEKGDISNCCLPVTKNKESYKLFSFLPIMKIKKHAGRTTYQLFGFLPIFKIRKMSNGITTTYYILNIPVMKVSRK